MESNGVPGLIHLSSDMHEAVDGMTNVFNFTCCGELNIKGKGTMTTYLARILEDGEGEEGGDGGEGGGGGGEEGDTGGRDIPGKR